MGRTSPARRSQVANVEVVVVVEVVIAVVVPYFYSYPTLLCHETKKPALR